MFRLSSILTRIYQETNCLMGYLEYPSVDVHMEKQPLFVMSFHSLKIPTEPLFPFCIE